MFEILVGLLLIYITTHTHTHTHTHTYKYAILLFKTVEDLKSQAKVVIKDGWFLVRGSSTWKYEEKGFRNVGFICMGIGKERYKKCGLKRDDVSLIRVVLQSFLCFSTGVRA